MEHIETVIVGAGQAGLALSRHLAERGHEHALLERGQLGQRWRTERWDSFALLTPNWHTRLPGHRYAGPDPEGFMNRAQVVDFFDRYARSFDAPVRGGTVVRAVQPTTGGWRVETDAGRIRARNVVVATGFLDRPVRPRISGVVPADVVQMHSSRYRRPGQLPDGGVLVVGAGPSGQQIADELARAGRRVHLAVGSHRVLPRRYRGRDAFAWMELTGVTSRTVDDPPGRPVRPDNSVLSGRGRLDLRILVEHGVVPHGRLLGMDASGSVRFDDGLAARLCAAERHDHRFRARVDAYIAGTGLSAPKEPAPPIGTPHWAAEAATALDLRAAGIRSVVWATGYGRDYSWLHAPVLDAAGEPVQRRGVTAAPGLYFIGLWFMWRRDSSFIDGVGGDAAHLAEHITARQLRSAA